MSQNDNVGILFSTWKQLDDFIRKYNLFFNSKRNTEEVWKVCEEFYDLYEEGQNECLKVFWRMGDVIYLDNVNDLLIDYKFSDPNETYISKSKEFVCNRKQIIKYLYKYASDCDAVKKVNSIYFFDEKNNLEIE